MAAAPSSTFTEVSIDASQAWIRLERDTPEPKYPILGDHVDLPEPSGTAFTIARPAPAHVPDYAWACGQCTFINEPNTSTCEVCAGPAPHTPSETSAESTSSTTTSSSTAITTAAKRYTLGSLGAELSADKHTGFACLIHATIHTGGLNNVCYSPDGEYVASSGGYGCNRAIVYKVESAEVVAQLEDHTSYCKDVQFNPGATVFASCSEDRSVLVYSVPEFELVRKLLGHTGTVWALRFTDNGRFLFSAGDDKNIIAWDTTTWEEAGRFVADGRIRGLSVGGSSLLAAASHENTVLIISVDDSANMALERTLEGHRSRVVSCDFSKQTNSQLLVSGSATPNAEIILWNHATGELIERVTDNVAKRIFYAVFFSPDGTHIIAANEDCTVRVYQTATRRCVAQLTTCHSQSVSGAAIDSTGGTRMITGSRDGSIAVWRLPQDITVASTFLHFLHACEDESTVAHSALIRNSLFDRSLLSVILMLLGGRGINVGNMYS